MDGLQIFENVEFGQMRTATIDGEPWFVGKDVAAALGYENPSKAIRDHVNDEDKIVGVQNVTPSITDSKGRTQHPTWINESGMYSLIFGSKLESARQFKHWVTSEVLPSLRKTGIYEVDGTYQILQEFIEWQKEHLVRQDRKEQQQAEFNKMIMERLEELEGRPQKAGAGSQVWDVQDAVGEESETERRRKNLNRLVSQMAKACGWERTFALHRLYKTLEEVLDISMDEYQEIYQAESGRDYKSTLDVVIAYSDLYKAAVRLCSNTIKKMSCS